MTELDALMHNHDLQAADKSSDAKKAKEKANAEKTAGEELRDAAM